jgi:hypothetical protein
MATVSSVDAQRRLLAEQIASEYLASKGWQDTDYSLKIQREEPGAVVVVEAIHKDDLRPQRRGAGRSLQIHVDLSTKAVTKELAYQ